MIYAPTNLINTPCLPSHGLFRVSTFANTSVMHFYCTLYFSVNIHDTTKIKKSAKPNYSSNVGIVIKTGNWMIIVWHSIKCECWSKSTGSRRLCSIWYPPETDLYPKSRDNFAHHLFLSYLNRLKFLHGARQCSVQKLQNDWITQADVMNERDFAKCEIKMSFGWTSYIAQPNNWSSVIKSKAVHWVAGGVA